MQNEKEELYKNRIRALHYENITTKREKEALQGQADQIKQFFRFLGRCKKRLKKIISFLNSRTQDD